MYMILFLAHMDHVAAFASLIENSNAAKVPRSLHLNTHKLNKYLGWIVAKSVPRDYFCHHDIKTLCLVAKTVSSKK